MKISAYSSTKKQQRNRQWKRNKYIRGMELYLQTLPEELVTIILKFCDDTLSFDSILEQQKIEIQQQLQNEIFLKKKVLETQMKYIKIEIIERLKNSEPIEFCSLLTKICNYIKNNYHLYNEYYFSVNTRIVLEDYNKYLLDNNEIYWVTISVNDYKKFILTELKKKITIQMIDGITKNSFL